ncbi:S-adenosyl-L-methionine-dependent methyltransferase [Polychaeton citri CBS 116435]|uniref:NOL1/NOP2/Sun domain family member 4 n=1 Tax=Polychaeton citri CBS 116435 TaxID=1314669 RepID=A0A9P4QCQ9_9PEZI|nr:S-adenosyl-L-methionine-dependent methyltransferase [Polychaeton citri CBS 116435]
MPALTKAAQKQAQAAEDSFNRTYATQYGNERWSNSLYPALAAPTRYAALVNQYAATESLPEFLTKLCLTNSVAGALSGLEIVDLPSNNKDQDSKRMVTYQAKLSHEGAASPPTEVQFPAPQVAHHKNPALRLMTHWNLDAASLLAVHLLSPQPGDKVLDLCAAPGGKSITMAQLLRSPTSTPEKPSLGNGCLHSNELDNTRNKRLAANLAEYLPASLFKTGALKVMKSDASQLDAVTTFPLGPGGYDKVLVDAPCSSERHIIHAHVKARRSGRVADEMATWRPGGSKKLAKIQAALLFTALKAARMDGMVLYATCSLSTEENDGVVEKVLQTVEKERKKGTIDWAIIRWEDWAERTKHGWIVLPDHANGYLWGPLYFTLLRKRLGP